MYVNPFWFGVITTFVAIFVTLLIAAIVSTFKRR